MAFFNCQHQDMSNGGQPVKGVTRNFCGAISQERKWLQEAVGFMEAW